MISCVEPAADSTISKAFPGTSAAAAAVGTVKRRVAMFADVTTSEGDALTLDLTPDRFVRLGLFVRQSHRLSPPVARAVTTIALGTDRAGHDRPAQHGRRKQLLPLLQISACDDVVNSRHHRLSEGDAEFGEDRHESRSEASNSS